MANEKTATKIVDVVCGKTVNPDISMYSSTYNGTTYHFCSEGCKMEFSSDPAKFTE